MPEGYDGGRLEPAGDDPEPPGAEPGGGEPACWAHLVDDRAGTAGAATVVDLERAGTGAGGAVWSLPHGGDLDANLVRLAPQGRIAEHANHEVDVLLVVRSGSGDLEIDGLPYALRPDVLALVPRGARRRITAGADGLSYLSIHRRRDALTITTRT